MKPPSVLGIISYQVFPAKMGGQKCAASFYSHLAKLTPVTLAVSKENAGAVNADANVFPFLYHHKQGIRNLRYIYRLQKLIKERNIDVVCIEHSYFGWMGILLRWLTKKPFVVHSHNIEAKRFRDMHKTGWRIYQWYEGWVHRNADHSFFITEEDKSWAIKKWQLAENACSVVTYGTDILQPPSNDERAACRKQLLEENGLDASNRLFLFNGTLDYLPNTDALRIIISELLPLLQPMNFSFRIFICGNRLSAQWEKVLNAYPGIIIYKGFVDDISLYFKGADCFINPVTLGSGIKTKLVDALAYDQPCISAKTGAKGIPAEITGTKLVLADDYDWPAFAQHMFAHKNFTQHTPPPFYQFFNWEAIVREALLSLQTL